jgi:3-oxoacyl-[acyl-carrier-protein] synthase-3
MRWESRPLYVAATGACRPAEVSAAEATGSGRYPPAEAQRSGQLAATVTRDGRGAPDLAVAAARQALRRSGYAPADATVLLHAVLFHAGLDVWNCAAYIQRELGMTDPGTFVSEVRNGCNGMGSVELAARYLLAEDDERVAVITAADCFPEPLIDRWNSTPGMVFGDGGAAVIVTKERSRAFARILSICSASDPALEALHRGDLRFGPGQFPIELRRRAKAFLDGMSRAEAEEVLARREKGLVGVVEAALADAGVKMADVEHVVYSFISRYNLGKELLDPLGIEIERTTWHFGSRTGHMGNCDVFAGLNYLAESGQLAAGQKVLLVGAGGGLVWTTAVLEVLNHPAWAARPETGQR